jgi:hypothetical protein
MPLAPLFINRLVQLLEVPLAPMQAPDLEPVAMM